MLLQEMTWPEIGNLSRDIPVMVPVAALAPSQRRASISSRPTRPAWASCSRTSSPGTARAGRCR